MDGRDRLLEILAAKRRRVAEARVTRPLDAIRAEVDARPPRPAVRFAERLAQGPFGFICEVKRGSPSRGLFAPDLVPETLARTYAAAGADAISVLTEEDHFHALPGTFERVRPVVSVPLLQKDFFFDPWQLWEARRLGADLVLLIAAVLDLPTLEGLLDHAREIGLECLVEVHDEADLDRTLSAGATLVGINNRNLRDFSVDLATTERLAPRVPADRVVIGESGIHTPEDVARLAAAGVRGVLVGEALVTHADPARRLAAFRAAVDVGGSR